MPDPAIIPIYLVVFIFSVSLHEAAHALVALLGGDDTAYAGGQVSLNPWPHIQRSPFGMVVLPIASLVLSGFPIGFASAPYDPFWARRHPRRAALMALAGPAANLSLAVLAFAALRLGHRLGYFQPPASIRFGEIIATDAGGLWPAVAALVGVGFSLNLLLGLFNLLPFPPLDGSGVVPLLLDETTTAKYQDLLASQPALAFLGIFAAWKLFGFVFWPVWGVAINFLYPGIAFG